jgi:integrase
MRLSVKTTEGLKLPNGKTEAIWFDSELPGFGLRVRQGGKKVWVYQYTFAGRTRRITIGAAGSGAITPTAARELAVELHSRVRLGEDVAATKAVSKAQAGATFANLARQYLEFQQGNLRRGSLREVRRHLETYAKPFHGLPVNSVDRRAIAERLNAIARDSGPVAANHARATWSAMYGWAMREGLATSNPVIDTNRREQKSRDRILSNDELRAIWTALEDDDYGAIIKLLALTGCRAREVGELKWSEVQDDMVMLAAERTKNARQHLVPLSPEARAVLDARPRRTAFDGRPRDYVFSQRDGKGFSSWSRFKLLLDARIEPRLESWVVHDLRRTFCTRLAEDLKVAPHVIEMCVNHVSGRSQIASIYNRSTLLPERRQALAMWGAHLLAIVENRTSNLTPLRRA